MTVMGLAWQTILVLTLALSITAQSLMGAQRLQDLALAAVHDWHAEFQIRECASLAATKANLAAAAAYLGSKYPDLEIQAETLAASLSDRLLSHYSPSSRPDVTNHCHSWTEANISSELHRQIESNQPRVWPNWISRLVAW
jgi:hypothetical protein